jgi:hypothetical protein
VTQFSQSYLLKQDFHSKNLLKLTMAERVQWGFAPVTEEVCSKVVYRLCSRGTAWPLGSSPGAAPGFRHTSLPEAYSLSLRDKPGQPLFQAKQRYNMLFY